MLNISGQTIERMVTVQSAEMVDKIVMWLQHELRGWQCSPGSHERDQLEKICRSARDFGMEVETDYALFALLVISQQPAVNYFDHPEVKEAMTDTSRNPASKLLWLEANLGGGQSTGDAGFNSSGRR